MKVYYSGQGGKKADPEWVVLAYRSKGTNIMLTYADMQGAKPPTRFRAVLKSRKA